MGQGGFDVIIGNPPWREYAAVRRTYQVRDYTTEVCGNLHGICTERALVLRSGIGRMSFIVQLPPCEFVAHGVSRLSTAAAE